MQTREESYRFLSAELHDNICQSILLAILNLQKAGQDEFQPAVRESIHILQNTLDELSDLSKTLNGEVIKAIGLKSAIQKQVDKLNRTKALRAYFTISGDDTHLNSNLELLLFRVIQEATSNVIKHAKASTLRIFLHYQPASLSLRIQDNGNGFDPASIHPASSGLKNMQERINLAQGNFNIETTPGKGTIIKLLVPLLKP